MIGIMQGRLVPPEDGRFQSFPQSRWRDEFTLASSVPLGFIEWIFDSYGLDTNPIWTDDGIDRLSDCVRESGVEVRSICADYFMERPFVRASSPDRERHLAVLRTLIHKAAAVRAKRIILPFVDNSAIDSDRDEIDVQWVINRVVGDIEACDIELHLETSLPPDRLARLLSAAEHPAVKVTYDSGNSCSLGYVVADEFAAYGHRIGSVHIKDRLCGGGTVPLGQGAADFNGLFNGLRKLGYAGDFTLQVARPQFGDEVSWARHNLNFLRNFWSV